MPINKSIPPVESRNQNFHWDQTPLTRTLDMEDNIRVRVLDFPSENTLKTTEIFARVDHRRRINVSPSDGEVAYILNNVLSGKTMWQNLERLRFTISFENVTRVFTHQLVRARVGVIFSQQCSGDSDWRHHDVIYPRSFSPFFDLAISRDLMSKVLYAKMIDSRKVTFHEARYVNSHALDTVIVMDIALNALVELYAKRTDWMSQTAEMIFAMEELKKEFNMFFPETTNLLKTSIERGNNWYLKVKDSPVLTHFYAPEGAYDTWDWNPESFVYGENSRRQMASGEKIPLRYYSGYEEISKEEYEKLSIKYKTEE